MSQAVMSNTQSYIRKAAVIPRPRGIAAARPFRLLNVRSLVPRLARSISVAALSPSSSRHEEYAFRPLGMCIAMLPQRGRFIEPGAPAEAQSYQAKAELVL